MAAKGELRIYVSGSITQQFEVIDHAFTIEEVIALVASGEALTSVGYGGNRA